MKNEFEKFFKKGGAEYISSVIKTAISSGKREATVSGDYEIASPVRLPSDFTLYLENCHLRMADGSYSNMFVNEHLGCGEDKNISLIGIGEVILDGGKYNGLSEKTEMKNGLGPIWDNSILLFANVDGFTVKGLHCRNQRWWALNFIYSRHGYIGDIDFLASDIWVDEKGEEHHGLLQSRYSEILVKNADGIDIRQGCQDIIIENITGFTEDDTVALTGINWRLEETFAVPYLPSDICNITIRNVRSAAYCSVVRLLNQGGVRLHDILIDGVVDTSRDCPNLDKGAYCVRIGDSHTYGTRQSTADETYNITVRNVFADGIFALTLACGVKNLVLENISFGG